MCANEDAKYPSAEVRSKTGIFSIFLVYPSWTMRYALVSLANAVTLAIGIMIGMLLAPHIERRAQAVSADPAQSQTPAPSSGPKITPVSPMISGGSAAFYTVLTHHVQSDEMVVNGYDLLKLQNGELQLLSRFVPQSEIQKVVDASKADELFTAAQPRPATSQQSPPK